jgi:hypothetical protein
MSFGKVTGLLEDVTVEVVPGMYPVHTSLPRDGDIPETGSLVKNNTIRDLNTEYRIIGIPSHYTLSFFEISLETSPGVWSLVHTDRFKDTLTAISTNVLTGLPSKPKVVFNYMRYGTVGSIDLSDSIDLNKGSKIGVSDVNNARYSPVVHVSNIISTTHSKKAISKVDTVTSQYNASAGASNLITRVHSMMSFSTLDTATSTYTKLVSVSNIITTIHTSTTVGG